MLTWLLPTYGVLVFAITATAAAVALFVTDPARRDTAYRILKLTLATTTAVATTLTATALPQLAHLFPHL